MYEWLKKQNYDDELLIIRSFLHYILFCGVAVIFCYHLKVMFSNVYVYPNQCFFFKSYDIITTLFFFKEISNNYANNDVI